MKSIHSFLKLQADLEALELAYHGERPPLPGASVMPIRPPPSAAGEVSTSGTSTGVSSTATSSCSSSWSLPCVSVDAEGNSYFTDKKVALGAGTGSGIGALSDIIPATGGVVRWTDI